MPWDELTWKRPPDLEVWLMSWAFSPLQVHQEAGTHLEGSRPRWREHPPLVHSVQPSTNMLTITLGQTWVLKSRGTRPFFWSHSHRPGAQGQYKAVRQPWDPCTRGPSHL